MSRSKEYILQEAIADLNNVIVNGEVFEGDNSKTLEIMKEAVDTWVDFLEAIKREIELDMAFIRRNEIDSKTAKELGIYIKETS